MNRLLYQVPDQLSVPVEASGVQLASLEHRRHRTLLITALVCLLLAAALVPTTILVSGAPVPTYVVIYLLALTCLAVLPVLITSTKQSGFWSTILISPIFLLDLNLCLLRLGWFNVPNFVNNSFFPALRAESLHIAAMLVVIANIMLWIGYWARPSRVLAETFAARLRGVLTNEAVQPNVRRIWLLFALGIAVRLYLFHAGVGGYFSSLGARSSAVPYVAYLNLIDGSATLALILYQCFLLKQTKASWGYFWLMLVVELITSIMTGFKGQTIYRFFYLAVAYTLVRRRFPTFIMLAAVFTLIAITPVNLAVRQSFLQGTFQAGNLGAIPIAFINTASGDLATGNTGNLLGYSLQQIAFGTAQLEPFAMVVQYAGDTGTRWYGSELAYPVFSFIPRALWPTKPNPSKGGWVYNVVYGLPGDSAQTQTVPGDLYLNFGSGGAFIGMLVIGGLTRGLTVLTRQVTSLRYLPLFPFLILDLSLPEADLGADMAGILRLILFSVIILRYLVPDDPGKVGG